MIKKLEKTEGILRTWNLLLRIIHFDIYGVVVGKVDKFHYHWPMYLLNFTTTPQFSVYFYEIHFALALDNFILTRADI